MFSCKRPVSDEYFILSSDASKVGGYIFDIDMADSLITYDLDFYTRIDSPRSKEVELQAYPLYLTWKSPVGETLSQTVYMDITNANSPTYFSKQIVTPFLKDISPRCYGTWQLKVNVPEALSGIGLRGIGLVVKRNTE